MTKYGLPLDPNMDSYLTKYGLISYQIWAQAVIEAQLVSHGDLMAAHEIRLAEAVAEAVAEARAEGDAAVMAAVKEAALAKTDLLTEARRDRAAAVKAAEVRSGWWVERSALVGEVSRSRPSYFPPSTRPVPSVPTHARHRLVSLAAFPPVPTLFLPCLPCLPCPRVHRPTVTAVLATRSPHRSNPHAILSAGSYRSHRSHRSIFALAPIPSPISHFPISQLTSPHAS